MSFNTSTDLWADGFGNWRVQFPTTGSDLTDTEYAITRITEELVQRGEISDDYVLQVGFNSSYRGRVEYVELDPSERTTPVMVG